MSTKPLIIAARYKLLLLLPFLVIVPIAIGLTLLNRKTEYASSANAWATRCRFCPADPDPNNNGYLTFAQNQSIKLNELLATDAFVKNVAQNADATLREVRSGTAVYATGTYTIVIRHAAKDPTAAQAVVQAIIGEFKRVNHDNIADDLKYAQQLDEQKLAAQKQTLNEATTSATGYLWTHPRAALAGDLKYVELKSTVQLAQQAVNGTRSHLDDLRSNTTADAEERLSFSVVDEPGLPTAPNKAGLKSLIALPAAALLLAISLSACIYAFVLKTDNSIRVAEDLQALPGLILLGTVPDVSKLRRRGWPKEFFRLAVTALGAAHR